MSGVDTVSDVEVIEALDFDAELPCESRQEGCEVTAVWLGRCRNCDRSALFCGTCRVVLEVTFETWLARSEHAVLEWFELKGDA